MNSFKKDSHIVSLIATCHGLSHFYQLVTPALFFSITDSLSLSYSEFGIALLFFYAISGIFQPIAGVLVDRFGSLVILLSGTVIYSLGIAAVGLAINLPSLILATTIAGIGNSIYHPADLSIINNCVTAKRVPNAYSMHLIGGMTGWALAPIVMVGLAKHLDWRTALFCVSLAGFAVSAAVYFSRNSLTYSLTDMPATTQRRTPFVMALTSPGVLSMLLFFTLHSVTGGPVQQFGQAIFNQLFLLSEEVVALYVSFFLIASGVGTYLGGYMLRNSNNLTIKLLRILFASAFLERLGNAGRITCVGMFFAGIGFLLIPLLSAEFALAMLLFSGFWIGLVSPARDALVRTICDSRHMGKVYGIVYSGLDIGALLVPIFSGLLADNGLAAFILVVCTFSAWLAALLSLVSAAGQKTVPAAS